MRRLWKAVLGAAFVCLLAAAVIGWTPLRDTFLGEDSDASRGASHEVVEDFFDLTQCLLEAQAKGYDVARLEEIAREHVGELDPFWMRFLLETCQQILR